MELLGRAPRQFTLYARNPAHNMTMGGNKSYFAPAYGSTYIADAGEVGAVPCLTIIWSSRAGPSEPPF